MNLTHCVVHEIVKEAGESSADAFYSEFLLEISEDTVALVEQLGEGPLDRRLVDPCDLAGPALHVGSHPHRIVAPDPLERATDPETNPFVGLEVELEQLVETLGRCDHDLDHLFGPAERVGRSTEHLDEGLCHAGHSCVPTP